MVYGGTAIRFCPAHARYPLTVLCFSLQKSLAPSLSSAPLPVQEARPSGPLEFVRGQVPVHTRTAAAPQSYMRITWATLRSTISSSRYLTHRSYSRLYMAASSRGQGFRNTFLSRSSIIILTRAIAHHGRGPSLPIWMDNLQDTTAGPPRLCRRQIECLLHIKVCRLALSPFCLRVMLLLPTARALIVLGQPRVPIADL